MQNKIPHFHGINFDAAEIETAEAKRRLFTALKEGEEGYYSEMALRNAILDFGESIPEWKQKILEQYYTKDIESALALIGDAFYEFQQQYVNSYKSGSKELERGIQRIISRHPVLRDLWFLSPKSASAATDAQYQEGREDAFVAMSKLPRHATEFAAKSIKYVYDRQGAGVHFIGMVLVSLHSPQDYQTTPHYDVLANKRGGHIKVNAHFKYQTEVDFLSTRPSFVFPIIIPDGNSVWNQNIQTSYGINQEDFNALKRDLASRRVPAGREEAIKLWYSAYMVRRLQAQQDINLLYVRADGNTAPFAGSVMTMQNDIVESSTAANRAVDRSYVHQQRTPVQYKEEAEKGKEVADYEIRGVLSQVTALPLPEALAALCLQEEKGIESYETISADRKIAVDNPDLGREERDGLLAAELGQAEKRRGTYFESKVKAERGNGREMSI